MIRQEANTKDTLCKPMKEEMKLLSNRFERMFNSFELMVGRRCKVEKEDVMATRSWRRSSCCRPSSVPRGSGQLTAAAVLIRRRVFAILNIAHLMVDSLASIMATSLSASPLLSASLPASTFNHHHQQEPNLAIIIQELDAQKQRCQ